ncbi:hypothetical protein AVEN_219932-1 [Araneus ventricosus]|uniref:Uncharacterized protein n=1 Tax=Araneus ventricosus TaxID=182803 RepID=A0A4Y2UIX1_ARAVE|nr:hypothetical protein AVEN_219932-1 [Araneus ventricosus]
MRKPGGQYAGHVTPASETGSDIAKSIHKYLEDNNVAINELESVGCDDIVRAIHTGQCDPDFAVRDHGPLSHSRWLTCANRVLGLFIFQTSPTSELKMLVIYIMKTYARV